MGTRIPIIDCFCGFGTNFLYNSSRFPRMEKLINELIESNFYKKDLKHPEQKYLLKM